MREERSEKAFADQELDGEQLPLLSAYCYPLQWQETVVSSIVSSVLIGEVSSRREYG